MRYHNITKDDMRNGDGLRAVLWVSGCTHRCPGCHNPVTWNIQAGLIFDQAAKEELFAALGQEYISGVTFSGGDPLHPDNRQEIGELIEEIRKVFPDKTIWLYTGYTWEDLQELAFLLEIDVLVDGVFIQEQKDNTLMWRGSVNQRVIDVKKSLAEQAVVLHCL